MLRVCDIVFVWYPPTTNNYVEGNSEGNIIDTVSKLIYKVHLFNGYVISAHDVVHVSKRKIVTTCSKKRFSFIPFISDISAIE